MAFLFSNTVRDIIRDRCGIKQLSHDRFQNKKRGNTAPQELSNLPIHGITPNGTYFFCTLVYQKDLTERKKISIFNLIDAYANTEDHVERVRLKSQIKEACGAQIEGIALLFSNSSGTYGFVTGNRVKVARWRDEEPLELDADELFSDSERQLELSFQYFVFILESEEQYTFELIREYIQGDEKNDIINTDVINAIKCINTHDQLHEDMSLYLKTACDVIENPAIRQQVKAVYDALQLLGYEDRDIKYKATVLTLQLLHSQDNEKRRQLLTDYTELASKLYGSKIPILMIGGICIFLLGASLLTLVLLTSPAIPLLMIIGSSFNLLTGLICGIIGKNEFYSDKAQQKRSTANTFFNLKENLNNMPEDLIPRELIESQ